MLRALDSLKPPEADKQHHHNWMSANQVASMVTMQHEMPQQATAQFRDL